jgi:hypothetical protein
VLYGEHVSVYLITGQGGVARIPYAQPHANTVTSDDVISEDIVRGR